MISRTAVLIASLVAGVALLVAPALATAAEPSCEAEPRPACFGIESVQASLSTVQAGAHPDFSLDVAVKQNPLSPTNVFGLHNSYAATRDLRFDIPPGLIGDPNALGTSQQCTALQLTESNCPNGSQIGISTITAYELNDEYREPVYMMSPPGGDVVARLGLIAGIFPTFIDLRVRSESDYGITAEVTNAPAAARVVKLESTFWGVPAAPAHDNERCTPSEAFHGCVASPSRPPGSGEAPFFTNPTRCGVSLSVGVNASSWAEPELEPEGEVRAPFPEITGCDHLPFGPSVEVEPTNHHTSAPTGLDMTIKLPASGGVKVLEPSQTRYIRIDLPRGLTVNAGTADGLAACSAEQVGFGENTASQCPDAAKLASTEFVVPVLERNLKGAIYLREPEPGHPYRIWIVADDLGLHVKLPGDLELDRKTGQIHSIVLGTAQAEGLPQAPLREVSLLFKSGFRAPLVTPAACGTYYTHYEFVPWSGGPPAIGDTPMQIDEGCRGGGFSPKLSAGSTDSKGGGFSPFTVTISREDFEQNISDLSLTLPRGIAASFAGIPRCEGAAAQTGGCPPESRIGRVVAAVGAGPDPLWVPQEGKRPTAVYLSGPYKGAPFSIVAVVPKQAGPFDFGDEVVRSATFVDPITAQATAKADPLPQYVEGTPLFYKAINVQLDRPNFTLNPTSCAKKETVANLTSSGGQSASPTASYAATDCAKLAFKPKVALRLSGGTHRGVHPKLRAIIRPAPGQANIAAFSVALPHSEFLDQGHIKTVCTRVQFAADECPAGAIYGEVKAISPLFDFPLEGKIYLRSSSHPLPDMVAVLKGPASMPIEIDSVGRVDSVNGGIRTTFETVPDAPVSKIIASFPGGKKGLLVNSTDICQGTHLATAKFTGQNGRRVILHQALKAACR
ncbi:MAG TPA: hypothetical protein VHR65_03585 [Solirubrobacterales bacterium]|jgi:hypothetical protein|nr:hypothetical protein [Solirubrobacterales bacterium]